MRKFVDSNIFLRFLLNDDPPKAKKVFAIFQLGQTGKVELITSDLVIAEVVWVLTSKRLFNLPKEQVKENLLPLLLGDFISFPAKEKIATIFEIFIEKNISFIDAYKAIIAKNLDVKSILSYDKDFDKIEFLKREEP